MCACVGVCVCGRGCVCSCASLLLYKTTTIVPTHIHTHAHMPVHPPPPLRRYQQPYLRRRDWHHCCCWRWCWCWGRRDRRCYYMSKSNRSHRPSEWVSVKLYSVSSGGSMARKPLNESNSADWPSAVAQREGEREREMKRISFGGGLRDRISQRRTGVNNAPSRMVD